MASPQLILIAALQEIGAIGIHETALPEDLTALCLSAFNRRVSQWNTRRVFGSYEYTYVFTLPASPQHSPNGYTMGASADGPNLAVDPSGVPYQIDSAKRVTTDTTPIETPIPVLTFQQWDALRIPGLITNLTVAVYLQPIPKLPILWCYGFETGAMLRLSWRSKMLPLTISAFASTTVDLSDGYEDALILTLAEDLSGAFQKPIPDDLRIRAREARLNIMSLNGKPEVAAPDYQTKGRPGFSIADFYARNV